jgi:hypothetical protein
MTKRLWTPWAVAAALALPTAFAHSQTPSGLPTPTPARCAQADEALRSGSLTQTDSQLRALGTASRCPDGGSSIAAAMERRRSVATSAPRGMTADMHFFTPPAGDTALLRVALNIAGDGGAGLAARVMSLRLLLAYSGGEGLWYEDLTGTGEGESCIPGGPRETTRYSTSNLPPDSLERIRQRAAPLEQDPTQHPHVRSAAHCVMNAWRMATGLPVLLLLPDPRPALTLEYVCGKRFSIRNALPYTVAVQFEVEGIAGRKRLNLMRKDTGQSYGATELEVDSSGELRLVLDGDVILAKANGGATCP